MFVTLSLYTSPITTCNFSPQAQPRKPIETPQQPRLRFSFFRVLLQISKLIFLSNSNYHHVQPPIQQVNTPSDRGTYILSISIDQDLIILDTQSQVHNRRPHHTSRPPDHAHKPLGRPKQCLHLCLYRFRNSVHSRRYGTHGNQGCRDEATGTAERYHAVSDFPEEFPRFCCWARGQREP